jgi:hypothetical protein
MSRPTGDHQYTVVGGELGLHQEGEFCASPWRYEARFAKDFDAEVQRRTARLHRVETDHHVMMLEPGSPADRDRDVLAHKLEEDYRSIVTRLEIVPLT